MSADTGDGNPFRVETNLPSKYTLCDNRWHNISSIYNGLEIGVKIDNNPTIFSNYRVAGASSVDKIYTKSPLYIGGLPGKIIKSFIKETKTYIYSFINRHGP